MADLTNKEMEVLYSVIKKASTEAVKGKKSVNDLSNAVEDLGKKTKKTASDMEDVNDNLTEFKDILNKISVSKLIKETKEFTGLSKEVGALNDVWVNFQKGVVDLDKSFKIFGLDIRNVSGLIKKQTSEVSSKVKDMIEKMDGISSVKNNFLKISDAMGEMKNNPIEMIKLLDELGKEFDVFKKTDLFESLDEESKKAMLSMEKQFKEGTLTSFDLIKNLNESIGVSEERLGKKYGNVIKEIIGGMDNVIEEHKKLNSEIQKSAIIEISAGKASAEIDDFLNTLKENVFRLDVPEIFSDSEILKGSELIKKQQELNALQKIMKEEIEEVSKVLSDKKSKDEDIAKANKRILDLQKEMIPFVKQAVKEIEILKDKTDNYAKALHDLTENDFGMTKAKEMEKGLFKMAAGADILAAKFKSWDGPLGGASKLFTELAGKMKGLAIPMAVLGGVYSLTKQLMAVNQEIADLHAGIVSAGIGIGVGTENMNSALDDAFNKSRNLNGLFHSWAGADAFSSTREQIVPVYETLVRTGKPAKDLAKDLAGVTTTAVASGNELLKASDMAKTFGYQLQMSDVEIAKTMGDMMYEYNASMGTIQKNFVDITNAAHGSGISTNRFMSIVQTATAGMSIYSQQISDTAKVVSDLGKKTNLSGSELERWVKGTTAMGKDIDQTMRMVAMTVGMSDKVGDILEKQRKEGVVKLEMEIPGMAEGKEKERAKLQLDVLKEIESGIKNKDILSIAGSVDQLPTEMKETFHEAVADQYRQFAKQNALGKTAQMALFKKIAKQDGMLSDQEVEAYLMASRNLEKPMLGLTKSAEYQDAMDKDYEKMQKEAIKFDKYKAFTTNQLLGAILEQLKGWTSYLTPIAMGLNTLISLWQIKNIGKVLIPEIIKATEKATIVGGGAAGATGGAAGVKIPPGFSTTKSGLVVPESAIAGTSKFFSFLSKFAPQISGGIEAILGTFKGYNIYQEAKSRGASKGDLDKIVKEEMGETGGKIIAAVGSAKLGMLAAAKTPDIPGQAGMLAKIGKIIVGGLVGAITGYVGTEYLGSFGKWFNGLQASSDEDIALEEKSIALAKKDLKQTKKYNFASLEALKNIHESTDDLNKEKIDDKISEKNMSSTLSDMKDVKQEEESIFDKIGNYFSSKKEKPATPTSESLYVPGFQYGTPSVPTTGLYQLHKGEEVVPAMKTNNDNGRGVDVTINIYGGDENRVRYIVREEVQKAKYS